MLPVMLPDVSSITTTVIGRTSLLKTVSGCGLPSSRISNSSRARPGTRRPASVTVAKIETVLTPDLKVDGG